MKVGFDISQLAHQGGVATYTQNLIDHLVTIKDIEMSFFYTSLRKPYLGKLQGVKSYTIPPYLAEILFNKLRIISMDRFIGKVDIFHSSDWMQPPTTAKKVTTYHDLVPLMFPQWSHPKIVAVHKKRLEIVEKEIDMVIAVSNSTKRDLMKVSKIPEEKITVIYEAAGEQFKQLPKDKVEEFRKKMGLPDNFILAIGGIGERRNLQRVKEAAQDYNLVITGETIPRVLDEQMPFLYNAADILLYPSLYEGFGLPILEAMKCGTPVITSNVSSMPEIAGDAAILVDPYQIEDIVNALNALMEGKDKVRNLINKGIQRADKFKWEKCAEETAAVYRKLLS